MVRSIRTGEPLAAASAVYAKGRKLLKERHWEGLLWPGNARSQREREALERGGGKKKATRTEGEKARFSGNREAAPGHGVRDTGRNDIEKIFTARWKDRTASCHGSWSAHLRVPVSVDEFLKELRLQAINAHPDNRTGAVIISQLLHHLVHSLLVRLTPENRCSPQYRYPVSYLPIVRFGDALFFSNKWSPRFLNRLRVARKFESFFLLLSVIAE